MDAMFIKHQCLEMAKVEPYAREAMIVLKEADYMQFSQCIYATKTVEQRLQTRAPLS